MFLTTLILGGTTARRARDAAFAHSLVFSMLGERGLWSTPMRAHMVIQHTHLVDWTRAQGVRHSHTVQIAPLPIGTLVEYALIGNATYCPSASVGAKRSNRVPLPPERSKQWLQRKLGDAFKLGTIDVTGLPPAIGRYHGRRTTHHRVLFNGTATVTDSDRLFEHQIMGVGPGKAYGCGLLVVQGVMS